MNRCMVLWLSSKSLESRLQKSLTAGHLYYATHHPNACQGTMDTHPDHGPYAIICSLNWQGCRAMTNAPLIKRCLDAAVSSLSLLKSDFKARDLKAVQREAAMTLPAWRPALLQGNKDAKKVLLKGLALSGSRCEARTGSWPLTLPSRKKLPYKR